MKALLKLLTVVCLFSAVDANAELKKYLIELKVPEGKSNGVSIEYELKSGEAFEIKSLNGGDVNMTADYGNGFVMQYSLFDLYTKVPSQISYPSRYPSIVGPAKLKFGYRSRGHRVLVVDFKKTSPTSSSPNTPSNTVVIPTDASGPVEIIMESSKDLVNWTRAEPGTYGADTPKRFFRVRAVAKP
jgi:hypothetical protein